VIEESFNQQYSSEAILSMQLLKEDISVVMRERAQKGYSMNVSEEITLKFKFYDQYNQLLKSIVTICLIVVLS